MCVTDLHSGLSYLKKVQSESCNTAVWLAAGKKAGSGQEQMGQVQISTAFQSPDLLQSCLAFLRQYATDTESHAACAVVPKQSIAYPQVQTSLVQCLCVLPNMSSMLTLCIVVDVIHPRHKATHVSPCNLHMSLLMVFTSSLPNHYIICVTSCYVPYICQRELTLTTNLAVVLKA